MTKYFSTNKDYFEFINSKKDKINIEKVKILKTRVKLMYNNIK